MWKRLIPWAVSLGLLAYLAKTHDLSQAWAAFQRVSLAQLALIAVASTLITFLYDSLCLTSLLRRFNAPVGFREVLPLKGASYLLNIVNYNAAMGGMALYLKRVRRVPFLEGASSLLFLNFIDVLVLAGVIGAGMVLAGDTLDLAVSPALRGHLLLILGVLGLVLLGCWLYWNAGFDFLVLGKLRSWRIFHAFRKAKLRDYAWLAGLRVVMILVYVTVTWLFARLFDLYIPFSSMMALSPIITFIGTIPLGVAGLGTTQVVMIAAFSPFSDHVDPAALILAMSTASISSVVLVRVAIGYFFLGRVSRRLEAPENDADPAGD